jgi:RNA polymerase sigma-70 factor (ECF subfamily)
LVGDRAAADDLVQDTLERACAKWRLWIMGSDLRAWLFTLMHNLHANDRRRALRRVPQVDGDEADAALKRAAAMDDSTALGMDLQRSLLQLPEEQRTVLLLVCLEDMTYAEVARITSTPIGTVMSRLSRARNRLQQLLEAPATPETSVQPSHPPTLRRLK